MDLVEATIGLGAGAGMAKGEVYLRGRRLKEIGGYGIAAPVGADIEVRTGVVRIPSLRRSKSEPHCQSDYEDQERHRE